MNAGQLLWESGGAPSFHDPSPICLILRISTEMAAFQALFSIENAAISIEIRSSSSVGLHLPSFSIQSSSFELIANASAGGRLWLRGTPEECQVCIQSNDGVCIKNDECCIENDGFCQPDHGLHRMREVQALG